LQTESIRQLNQGQKTYENKNDIQYSVDNKTINTSAKDLYEYVDPSLGFTTCVNNIDGVGLIKYRIVDANLIDYPHLRCQNHLAIGFNLHSDPTEHDVPFSKFDLSNIICVTKNN
jgi:hypothetical protein